MLKIKEIRLLPFAKIMAVLQALIGLITGIFFSFVAMFDPVFLETQVGPPGSIFGVWSFIMVPIINAIIGFVSGIIMAWLYNYLAGLIGGIEIQLENVE